jgi:hypothetical protein
MVMQVTGNRGMASMHMVNIRMESIRMAAMERLRRRRSKSTTNRRLT